MNASEILTNAKAYAALKSLQGLNRLAEQAFTSAMAQRSVGHNGTVNENANAEAQSEYREAEFASACKVQAQHWNMDISEVRALAMGEHAILH